MSINRIILKDLVCGMSVNSDDISADYQGNHYTFCSEQCRERFQANPKIYIGAQNNSLETVRGDFYECLTLKLAEALPIDVIDWLTEDIRKMMGIQYIEVYNDEVEISYDPLQVTETQIETAIARSGKVMGEEWAAILNRAFIHAITESTGRP